MLWLYLLIGLISGFCSGLLGVGGGFILIPLLLLARIPVEAAVSASLVFIFFTSASGTLRHGYQGTVDWRLAAVVGLSSISTTIFGSFLTVRLPSSFLQAILGTCIVAGLFVLNRPPTPKAELAAVKAPRRWTVSQTVRWADRSITYPLNILKAIWVGGGVGFLTGLLGVGGGFLKVPAFVGFMAIPLRIAIGTSLLTILGSALVGAVSHWGQGSLNVTVVWTTALMGVVGAQLGAALLPRLTDRFLKILVNGLLALSAAFLFSRAAMGA